MIKLKLSTEPRFFVIDIPVYETELIVSSRAEIQEIQEYLEDNLKQEYLDTLPELIRVLEEHPECGVDYDACFLHNGALNLMILTPKTGNNPLNLIPIITHEALHATIRILEVKGIRMSEDSEEAYTYLQQYLVKEILRGLREEEPIEKKTRKWWERSK